MIFRRLKSHIESENWFAVFVDFAIVVSGVFIGIQVANWNAARGAEAEYARALARLETETQQNLALLDIVDTEVSTALGQVQNTLAVLQDCSAAPPDSFNEDIKDTLQTIWLSRGVHLRQNTLRKLTTDPDLLAQQSEEQRRYFADTLFYLERLQAGSDTIEDVVYRLDVHKSPVISIGPAETVIFDYFGSKATRTVPTLRINAPFSDVCRDELLAQNLYLWTSQQSAIPSITGGARSLFKDVQTFLRNQT